MSNSPMPKPNPRAKLLRYLLWGSELALVLAVLYALANRPAQAPAPTAPAPSAVASPQTR